MARGYKDYRQVVAIEEPEGKFSVHHTTQLYDDFEDTPLKWNRHPLSVGAAARIAGAAYNGAFGLEICTQKPGAVAVYNWQFKIIPFGERRTIELSAYWRMTAASDDSDFEFWVHHYEDPTVYDGAIRFHVHTGAAFNGIFQLYTAGAWQDLTGNMILSGSAWHEIMLACDFATGRYLYARLNGIGFRICGIPLNQAGTGVYYDVVDLIVRDNAGASVCMHVDDVLAKEP